MSYIKLVILGSDAPLPGGGNFPSVAIVSGKNALLLDAGEGTQERLLKAGISLDRIRCIMITHLHGDHVFGLLPILQSRSLGGSTSGVTIFGPPGIQEYLYRNFEMTYFTPKFPVEVFEVSEGSTKLNDVVIHYFPLKHSVPTVGYKVCLRKKCIAYVTDTRPIDSIVGRVKASEVLIHDATFTTDLSDKAEEYGHSTAYDAAVIASKAGVKLLILYHASPRYKDKKPLCEEARKVFKHTYCAEKFMKVIL